jgi:uncharacterized oligopeptide transporter (OPT) family protein
MTGRGVHRYSTVVLSLLMVAIGVALIAQVVGADAVSISGRLLLGVLFLVAGVGRLYVESKRSRRE